MPNALVFSHLRLLTPRNSLAFVQLCRLFYWSRASAPPIKTTFDDRLKEYGSQNNVLGSPLFETPKRRISTCQESILQNKLPLVHATHSLRDSQCAPLSTNKPHSTARSHCTWRNSRPVFIPHLETLAGGERHARLRQLRLQLVEHRRAQAGRHVPSHALHDTPDGVSRLSDLIDALDHAVGGLHVWAADDVRLYLQVREWTGGAAAG